jgi:hypothetical protein
MNLLRFSKPNTAISIGRSQPVYADHTVGRSLPFPYEDIYKLHRTMPSLARNIVAFYLRLSGTQTSEIASLLDISSSRALSASAQGAKYVLHKWNIPAYLKTKVLDNKVFRSPTRLERLTLHVDRAQSQLVDAETVMSWLHRNDDIFLISAALKIGKASFKEMQDECETQAPTKSVLDSDQIKR